MVTGTEVCQLDRFLELELRAAQAPNAIALLAVDHEPLTYSTLWDQVQTARRVLRQAGLQPQEPVALVMRGAELITAFLAIAGVSAVAPLNTSFSEDEYRFYLSRLGARFLLIQDDLAEPATAAAKELGMRVLRVRSAPGSAAGVFTVDPEGGLPVNRGRETDAALLLYTSATTGNPKLIPLTAANLAAIARNNAGAFQLDQSDRFLTMVPLFHSHGLGAVLTQLFRGGSVICTPSFDPENFLRWLDEFRPTWISGGPPVLHALLTLANEHPADFQRAPLRFIQSSGAPAHPELIASLEDVLGVPVLQGYGMTEAVGIARSTPTARKPGSVGRSIGCDVAIMDDSGDIVPSGTEGEIVVHGPTLMSGYLDDPEANRTAFCNGWFRTGDIGHLDSEGFLFITGRLKEIINRGGQKIMPSEIDRVLAMHPQVRDAAAFPVPHPTLGDDVAAAVVLRTGSSASERELRRFSAAHLASFKVPRRIIFLDTLPRGPAGKVLRRTLTEQFHDLAQKPPDASRPPDATELRLIEIWRRILSVSQVGVHDDFFQLGGDSLSAAVMLADVQREITSGSDLLNPAQFFEQPTVASLAQLLSSTSQNGHSSTHHILQLQTRGSRIPFFCFAPDYLDPYYLRHLSKCLGDEQPFYVVCPPGPVQDNRLLKVEELARVLVAAIMTVRPHGPYVLGGHCYGGVVSFEAALQLLAQGEEISRLVFFDVPAPGYPKIIRSWRKYLTESGRMLSGVTQGEIAGLGSELARHGRRLANIIKRRFGGRTIRAMAAVGTPALAAPQNPRHLTALALWEYHPRDFPAPIVQFLAADEPISTKVLDDPRLGWRDFARAGLALRTTPGRHGTMLDAENTPALAAQLEPLLRERSIAGESLNASTVHR